MGVEKEVLTARTRPKPKPVPGQIVAVHCTSYDKHMACMFLLINVMGYLQCGMPNNVGDLEKQPFYRFLQRTYVVHPIALAVLLYAMGGLPFIVWGMNGTSEEVKKIVSVLNAGEVPSQDVVEVVVSPPYVFLSLVKDLLRPDFHIAAQNCWVKKGGAFTGEVMELDLDCFGGVNGLKLKLLSIIWERRKRREFIIWAENEEFLGFLGCSKA